jgi:ubiquitin-protein ligase
MSELQYSDELDKWKSQTSYDKNFNILSTYRDTIEFIFENQTFTISPSDETFQINYETTTNNFTFFKKINEYIKLKGLSLSKILLLIEKKYNNKIEKKQKQIASMLNEEPDIERAELKDYLNTIISKSDSIYISKIGKSLFDGDIPARIIANQYLDCDKEYQMNSNIKIKINNDNIFYWNVKFNNLKNMKNNEFIEFNVKFHDKFYPNYPPQIEYLRPLLKDSLVRKISKLRMINLDYWSPSRNMIFVLNKLYQIFDKFANITDKPVSKFPKLDTELLLLESLFSDDIDDIDDDTYIKLNLKNINSNTNSKNSYFKSGTGYSMDGNDDKWNIEKYLQLQKEKDTQINNSLNNILNMIQIGIYDNLEFVEILKESCLIEFIKTKLRGATILDANKHYKVYKLTFSIIVNLINDMGISLIDVELYQMIQDFCKKAELVKNISQTDDIDDEVDDENDISSIIISISELLEPLHIYFNNDSKSTDKFELSEHKINYQDAFVTDKFKSEDIIKSNYTYKLEVVNLKVPRKVIKRIAQEYSTLMDSLPLYYESSIFFRSDDSNVLVCRAMITGPDKTPYDSGCMIFDIAMPHDYPARPPKVKYITTGGKRFNPNLYACGKVCLSLLGTWAGESWNPEISTLHQILISIQSQILVDEPYFNEPGYQKSIGTASGKLNSKNYNNSIRLYTMNHTMIDLLENKDRYPEFRSVINKHFKRKKDYILETCKEWVNESDNLKDLYDIAYDKLSKLLNEL